MDSRVLKRPRMLSTTWTMPSSCRAWGAAREESNLAQRSMAHAARDGFYPKTASIYMKSGTTITTTTRPPPLWTPPLQLFIAHIWTLGLEGVDQTAQKSHVVKGSGTEVEAALVCLPPPLLQATGVKAHFVSHAKALAQARALALIKPSLLTIPDAVDDAVGQHWRRTAGRDRQSPRDAPKHERPSPVIASRTHLMPSRRPSAACCSSRLTISPNGSSSAAIAVVTTKMKAAGRACQASRALRNFYRE